MRPTCLECAGKHLAQACVLIKETKTGYPAFRWYVIGHLAEAEEETVRDYPTLANEIREYRTEWADLETLIIPFEELFAQIDELLLKESDEQSAMAGDETQKIVRGAAGTDEHGECAPMGEFGPTSEDDEPEMP